MNNLTRRNGIQNSSCGLGTREFGRDGREFPADWRISNGAFLRDPSWRPSLDSIRFGIQSQMIIMADKSAQNREVAK